MIATVSPSSANCEHTINTLRYADRVKELKGPSNLNEDFSQNSQLSAITITSPAFKTSIPIKSAKQPQTPTKLQNPILVSSPLVADEIVDEDELMDDSSPLKLTESDDSFLLSTFSNTEKRKSGTGDRDHNKDYNDYVSSSQSTRELSSSQQSQQSTRKSSSASKLKESLHHSIAVLYDRVSNCQDADLLELLGDELEGLLAAFNK